jgi:hypothetical protein
MNPFDPANVVNLSGTGTMRGVTLALPTRTVRDLVPNGLELGSQSITPPGTHPVMLGFHDIFRLHLSIPSLLPNMTYHEHSVGIPFCYTANSPLWGGSAGPYFYMPTLRLDNVLATMGGVFFWGLPKQLARIDASSGWYRVLGEDGRPLVTISWEDTGDEFRPIDEFANFPPIQQALEQPLIGMAPCSIGPWFVVADFPKRWEITTIRPISTVTDVHSSYVVGFSSGRYPENGSSAGIDSSVLGSFEMRTEFLMSAPYPPFAH